MLGFDTLQEIWKLLRKCYALLVSINDKADAILELLKPSPAEGISFDVIFEDGTKKENVMAFEMTADQKVTIPLKITKKNGSPASVDGAPVWANSDDTVGKLTVADDGMSAVLVGVVAGAARLVVTADADLGAGVTPITGALDYTITPGALPTIELIPGTPEDQ